MVNTKWPPRLGVKVTRLLDYVKNVIIRFAMVENLYVIDISFLSVTERPVLGIG